MKLVSLAASIVGFCGPALADGVMPPPAAVAPIFSTSVTTYGPATPGPGMAATANQKGLGPATLQAILAAPGRNGTITLEDVLAAMTRPIRLYDLNGDGLSADELAIPGEIAAARMRAQSLAMFLSADLNNDRQVTRQEFDLVSKAGRLPDRLGSTFTAADTNGDGILSWDEMSAPRPGYGNMDQFQEKQLRALTLDIDPTPDTNFTLADAKTAADSLMAMYDLDHNGVIDMSEMAQARNRPR